jgi:hypothetical protein
MKTRKLYHSIITVFPLFILVSCNPFYQDEPEDEDSEPTQNDEVEEDFTPNSLIGKTIKIDSETRYYDFTSSGTCSAYSSTLENVYGTPQYSYSRTNGTQATFWAKDVDKRIEKNEYSKTNITYYKTEIIDFTLSFTSKAGGTYSGKLTISRTGYSVGSIYVAAKTSIYSPKGNFSIY